MAIFIRMGLNKSKGGGYSGFTIPDEPDGCWPWTGHRDRSGYGTAMNAETRRRDKAHRVLWALVTGRRAPAKGKKSGYELHHVCENKGCVNPSHLQLLTLSDHRKTRDRSAWDHLRRPVPHGTLGGYCHRRCRCPECSAAASAYFRAYRNKKKTG